MKKITVELTDAEYSRWLDAYPNRSSYIAIMSKLIEAVHADASKIKLAPGQVYKDPRNKDRIMIIMSSDNETTVGGYSSGRTFNCPTERIVRNMVDRGWKLVE